MRKVIFISLFFLGIVSSLFAQSQGIVLATYYDTEYMNSLRGDNVQLPENFLREIEHLNILSYEQAFPYSTTSSLKSVVMFYCKEHPIELVNYLNNHASHLFSNVEYELPSNIILEYNPTDYFWNEKKLIFQEYVYHLWHLRKIEADKAWDITKGDPNIKIAVIDYGFDAGGYLPPIPLDKGHPDLEGKINKYDPICHPNKDSTLLAEYCHLSKESHGTIVACLAAGVTDGGGSTASVGFNCGLIAYQLSSTTYPANLVQIAYHAAAHGASVINFSNYCDSVTPTPYCTNTVKDILNQGVVIVRSAGNNPSANDTSRYPFAKFVDERIIIVSTTDHEDNHADPYGGTFHAHYPAVTLCAPGWFLTTAVRHIKYQDPYPYYDYAYGSSCASPIVAGVCGLIKSIAPSLPVAEVKHILQATADPIADEHLYHGLLGAGRVNAYRAVCMALSYSEPDVITSNIVWDGSKKYSGGIVILPNAQLTINSTLCFAEGSSITVQPGGKLIINGGKLTNACPNTMWQGITVYGDPNLPFNYGYVEVRNGGTIQNAIAGITVKAGAKVKTDNAQFINNRTGVYFEYLSGQTGMASSFLLTDFIKDNNFFGNPITFDAHIKAQSSGNIDIKGCTFSGTGIGYGIWATGTNLDVREYCSKSLVNVGDTCLETYRTKTVFSGFNNGIYYVNWGTLPSLKVQYCDFENCYTDMYIIGTNYPELLRNTFDVTQSYGMLLREITGYRIEENTFKNTNHTSGNWSTGLFIENSGIAENEVYKNSFTDLYVGQNFTKQNSTQVNPFTGLQTLCNTFKNNQFKDILVGDGYPVPDHSIRKIQGSSSKPAGNQFISRTLISNPLFLNIDNSLSPFPINYYCRNSNNEYPNSVSGNVTRTITTSANTCPSKIGDINIYCCDIIIGQTKGEDGLEKYLAQYDEWNQEYQYWLAQLLATDPNSEAYEIILDKVSYFSALKDNYFNSIIVAVMGAESRRQHAEGEEGEGANGQKEKWRNETLRFLFNYRNHYTDNLCIVETYLAESNYREALVTLAKIYEKFKLTEEQVNELTGLQIYVLWLQQLNNEGKNIYELSAKELDYLINFVKTNTGRGAVFAKIILCELYGICIEAENEKGEEETGENSPSNFEGVSGEAGRGSLSACSKELDKITLVPNPTTGELTIDNGELTIKNVEVFDIYGRKHHISYLTSQISNHQINIAHLPAGIYFVKVYTEQGVFVEKVIKN